MLYTLLTRPVQITDSPKKIALELGPISSNEKIPLTNEKSTSSPFTCHCFSVAWLRPAENILWCRVIANRRLETLKTTPPRSGGVLRIPSKHAVWPTDVPSSTGSSACPPDSQILMLTKAPRTLLQVQETAHLDDPVSSWPGAGGGQGTKFGRHTTLSRMNAKLSISIKYAKQREEQRAVEGGRNVGGCFLTLPVAGASTQRQTARSLVTTYQIFHHKHTGRGGCQVLLMQTEEKRATEERNLSCYSARAHIPHGRVFDVLQAPTASVPDLRYMLPVQIIGSPGDGKRGFVYPLTCKTPTRIPDKWPMNEMPGMNTCTRLAHECSFDMRFS